MQAGELLEEEPGRMDALASLLMGCCPAAHQGGHQGLQGSVACELCAAFAEENDLIRAGLL